MLLLTYTTESCPVWLKGEKKKKIKDKLKREADEASYRHKHPLFWKELAGSCYAMVPDLGPVCALWSLHLCGGKKGKTKATFSS